MDATPQTELKSVCVFAASSQHIHADYRAAARRVGQELAGADLTVVYGGGAVGLMGEVADGALERGGRVVGVLPEFMHEVEWGHPKITELQVVENMHERKQQMETLSDAFIALPGGCGTFEELLEVITWKRLAIHRKPIVVMNIRGYYDPLKLQLERAVEEGFMGKNHADLWLFRDSVDDLVQTLRDAPAWAGELRDAAVK